MKNVCLLGCFSGSLFMFASFGAAAERVTDLGMDTFRQAVREVNRSLAARQLDLEISEIEARGEWGVLEPALVGSLSRRRTERLNSIEQTLSQRDRLFQEDADSGAAGVEGLLPWGTQYWVGTSMEKRSNNLTSDLIREPFTNEYIGFAGVRVSQPLLKNAGMSSVLARVRLADVEVKVKQQILRKRMMEIVSRAELAYWNLTLAQDLYELRAESVRIAEGILEDNQERVRAGKMSESEVLEAQAGLALRLSQLSEASQTLLAARNNVRAFLSQAPSLSGADRISAVDQPVLKEADDDFGMAMGHSLAHHPDYLAQQEIVRQEDVRIAFNQVQRWPEVDLVGSYGLNGLGDSFSSSYDQIGSSDFEAWTIGLEVRIPLGGGVRERADLRASRLRKQQALMDLKTAEVEIANALHTALNRVQATRDQVGRYTEMVDVSSQLLENEIHLLEAGRSDSRRVFQIEQDLVDARIAHYQSLVEHRRAWLDWEVAKGVLLDARAMEPNTNRIDG